MFRDIWIISGLSPSDVVDNTSILSSRFGFINYKRRAIDLRVMKIDRQRKGHLTFRLLPGFSLHIVPSIDSDLLLLVAVCTKT